MSETMCPSDSSHSLNSLRRKAAEKAEEAIREQIRIESDSESGSDTECGSKSIVKSSSDKVDKKAEEVTQEHESDKESQFKATLKPSASTSSFGSQRSVPRRRAAYKAAARIRKIAQQEQPSSDSEMEEKHEVKTPTQPSTCVQRRHKNSNSQIFEKPVVTATKEEEVTVLSVIQTLLLLSLLLMGIGQTLAFFQNNCRC